MRGANIFVTITRESTLADNVIGGRRYSIATIAQNVPARLSAVRPSADLLAQGIQTGKVFTCSLQHPNRDIQERDIITPTTGTWANNDFRVTGIQVDSILPTDPRGHLSIGLERMESARTIQ